MTKLDVAASVAALCTGAITVATFAVKVDAGVSPQSVRAMERMVDYILLSMIAGMVQTLIAMAILAVAVMWGASQ